MFLNFYPSVSLSFSADFLSTDPFSSAKIYSLNFLGGKTVEPLVTIIVPVYNTQEYLTRCLDSIVNQSYRHFELLLIDDGSRDDSGRICDDYAAKDSRIKVFHLENGGVSNARNFALNHASGEYIQFLDSDDWISPEATRLFVRTITTSQCDMVISDFYRVSGKRLSQKGDIEEDGVMTRQEFANIMLENPADFYYGVLWNKFYRREIIESVHLRMDPQISWCEDFLFNLEYIRHANSFAALQVPVYYYVKRKGSLISTQSINLTNTMKMKLNVFEYYNRFYKDVYDEEAYENIRLQVYRFFITSASYLRSAAARNWAMRKPASIRQPLLAMMRFWMLTATANYSNIILIRFQKRTAFLFRKQWYYIICVIPVSILPSVILQTVCR